MADDLKNTPVDMPEGKMEMSLRVLGNELIGIKMVVDDFKMKWLILGVAGLAILLWAGANYGPSLMSLGSLTGG